MNEILCERTQVSGYRIYAIYDKQGRCLYGGYTKNLKSRMRQHLRSKREWLEYLVEGDDPCVVIYDHDDVDRIALERFRIDYE